MSTRGFQYTSTVVGLPGLKFTFNVKSKSYKCVFSKDQQQWLRYVTCLDCREVYMVIQSIGKVLDKWEITAGTVIILLPCFAVVQFRRR